MLKNILKTGLAICLATTILNAQNGIVKGEVIESINASGYTYLKLKTKDSGNKWAAVMQGDYKAGTEVVINEDMTIQDFKSKALGVTFDTIIFGKVAKDSMQKPVKKDSYDEDKIVKTTISELLMKSNDFTDKIVQVQGKVTKVSKAIMKSNWIHLEDKEANKIIFRSLNDNVTVGKEVIATGKASTNVDYGYGYKYKIIITDSIFK